jgi:hypothetical protein
MLFVNNVQPTYCPRMPIKRSTFERQEQTMANSETTRPKTGPDEGMRKGAVEDDAPYPNNERRPQHGSLSGQLGHRDQDEMLKDADTDFPEPDAEGEHTGE